MVLAAFSTIGCIQELVFGVNANNHSQKIGFAFIKYATHAEACSAVNCLDGTVLLDKTLKVQLDPGFEKGREFGRGKTGHQRYKEKERTLRQIEKKLKSKHFKELDEKKKVNELVETLNAKIKLEQDDKDKAQQEKPNEDEAIEEEKEVPVIEIKKESEFDIIIPPKKKRRMDPKIAQKLEYASKRIDDANYLNRMRRNHQHDAAFDDIISMMQSTMSDTKNQSKQKKIMDEPMKMHAKYKGKKKVNKKRKTYKAKRKRLDSLTFEELMQQYKQLIDGDIEKQSDSNESEKGKIENSANCKMSTD